MKLTEPRPKRRLPLVRRWKLPKHKVRSSEYYINQMDRRLRAEKH